MNYYYDDAVWEQQERNKIQKPRKKASRKG